MVTLDKENKINLQPSDFIGRMVAVLGITGSGKTNTAAVLIEELLTAGITMTIVDIEGEYYGLKEKFEILVVGKSENVDLEITSVDQAKELAKKSIEKNISVVLDISQFEDNERFDILLVYFTSLWDVNFNQRKPYAIFLEEAHEFIPQNGRTPLKQVLTRLALRGRKRGFSVVLMSQRSAKIDKDVLTQSSLMFLHKVVHPTDVAVYKELIPLPAKEVESMVSGLERGQAIVLDNSRVQVIKIRLRNTLHVGSTPELAGLDFKAKKIDIGLLAELRKAVVIPVVETAQQQVGVKTIEKIVTIQDPKLVERVKELESLNQSLQSKLDKALARVKELEGQSKISNQVTPTTTAIVKLEQPAQFVNDAVSPLRVNLTDVEQSRLNRTLTKLSRLGRVERAVLNVLLENDGKELNRQQLAKITGYTVSSLSDNRVMSNIGKISFYQNDGGNHSTNFKSFVKEAFPGVSCETIFNQIKAKL